MKPLFKDLNDLNTRAKQYFDNNTIYAPRSFRIFLGVSKYTLSHWKKSQPDYYNLIKSYEDLILAKVEEYAIYGSAHPDLRKHAMSTTYNADGEIIKEEVKFNQVGAIFILRAYDKEQYVPEIAAQLTQDNVQQAKLIEFVNQNTTAKKGVQSDRDIKLLERTKDE